MAAVAAIAGMADGSLAGRWPADCSRAPEPVRLVAGCRWRAADSLAGPSSGARSEAVPKTVTMTVAGSRADYLRADCSRAPGLECSRVVRDDFVVLPDYSAERWTAVHCWVDSPAAHSAPHSRMDDSRVALLPAGHCAPAY